MKFGLTKSEFEYIQQNVVRPLQEIGAEIYCYGSRARGDFSRFSDLDLMIEKNSSEEAKSLRSEIEENLTRGNFPYKVDLVFLDEFAQSYVATYQRDKKPW